MQAIGTTLTKLAQDPRIEEIYRDDDGYWLITARGYKNSDDPHAALHTYHEETVTALVKVYRGWAPVPCNCERCS